jgi:hypothetical protein
MKNAGFLPSAGLLRQEGGRAYNEEVVAPFFYWGQLTRVLNIQEIDGETLR